VGLPLPTNGEADIIIIGDEILCGKRRDRHFEQVLKTFAPIGWQVAWVQYLGDNPERLTQHLQQSMAQSLPVFCFGGIGATPDDVTRQCAAKAAGVELVRHPQAVAEIEAQFSEAAYPNRILMAELPAGSAIIPNPINRVPGFSYHHYHFFPGFPRMAWPMLAWVMAEYYQPHFPLFREKSVKVYQTPESQMISLMRQLQQQYPSLKFFSLPHLGEVPEIELGVRGKEYLEQGYQALLDALDHGGYDYHPRPDGGYSPASEIR